LLYLYCLNVLVGIIGFILYLSWWIHERSASWVFKYLTFLFIGVCASNSSIVTHRYYILTSELGSILNCEFQTIWFIIGKYLHALCLFLIVSHSLYRLLFVKKKTISNLEHVKYIHYKN
jgi:hypothetical protein